ncbi:MAG: hypothetical protein FJX77_14340, partial [Armatimonadetes bacterium]|nr:hypothetical protein [Armatimonadota bacterium]
MERRGCGGNPGLVFWLGCWLLGLGLAARAGQGAAGSLRELARADRLYQEKSYALALPLYEQLQQGPALPRERRDDVGLRIVVCLGKTKKWDRARDGTLEYLKAHANTLWEARALVWLAALYDVLPDSGRLVGSRLVRDADGRIQDFPEASGRVSVHSLNHRNRLAALEAAQVLYHRYQGMAGVEEEIVQLNYVLLAALAQTGEVSRWAHRKKWASPSDPLWRVNPAAEYSPDWPPPLKCRYLYDQIGQLWSRLRPGDRRAELALLAEAGWLHAYHRGMRPVARTDVPMRPGVSVPLPYPYQNDDPLALLREVVRRGPNDSLADQAAIQIAEWKLGSDPIRFVPPGRPDLAWLQFQGGTRGGDDVPGAVADLRRFLQTRSHSRWAATARELLQRITSPDLSLKSAHLGPLQRRMVVPISYRGVQELRFRLYPARLPEAFVPGQMGPREEAPFSPFRTPRGPEPWYGPQATTWRIETPEAADYRIHSTQVELPIRSPGAYVLEATGDRIQARAYLLVGALTVIAIPDRRRILYFAADS